MLQLAWLFLPPPQSCFILSCLPDTHITYSRQLLSDPSGLRDKILPFRIHPTVKDGVLGAQDIGSAPEGEWSE